MERYSAHQSKTNHRIIVDNTGEATPFDWYHARFNVDFKLQLLADAGNVAANVQSGIVNSAFSLINKLDVKMNGVSVYDCSEVNHATNIKNLLEYSQGYAKSQLTNEFFYLDTVRNNELNEFATAIVKAHANNARTADNDTINVIGPRNNNYNSGFVTRKTLLVNNAVVNAEIPLNRYGFFERLYDELLPNTKIELNITLESDANLAYGRK